MGRKRDEDGRTRLAAASAGELGSRLLVLGAPGAGRALLAELEGIALTHRGLFAYEANGADELAWELCSPGANDELFDSTLVYLPKGRERRELLLDYAVSWLRPGGTLALVGTKAEGVKSARKDVERRGRDLRVRVGHHAQLLLATVDAPRPFAPAWTRWEDPLLPIALWSLPGVFAHGRLDDGSRMLLQAWRAEHVDDAPLAVLDLAAGAGVMGLAIAAWSVRAPVLTLSDADALATASARRSAQEAGVDAEVVLGDGYAALGTQRFDRIVCNPPFHQGVATEYGVADRMIREAGAHLRPGGELWLVANAFLQYEEAFRATFAQVDEVARDRRFKVWRGRRARA